MVLVIGDVLQLTSSQVKEPGPVTVVAVIPAKELPDPDKAPEWFDYNISMYVRRAKVDRLVTQRPSGGYVIIPLVKGRRIR